MKVLFTCGGTAGHVNPALAVAQTFEKYHPGCQVLFVGAEKGMEKRLVEQAGYPIRCVKVSTFERQLSWKIIRHNFKSVFKVPVGQWQASRILRQFKPDLVVGTGGYASFPAVREATRMGIPTAIHESNAFPGLTTRVLAKRVDLVMVGFPEAAEYYTHAKKVAVTGTPVRGAFFRLDRVQARRELGYAYPDNRSQLLGWPDIIQNNMTLECELVSRGYYLGGSWESVPQEERDALRTPSVQDWRLLFQLDTVASGDFELMFGDCGRIYFYIRREDLLARRFDRAWLVLQCM